MCWSATKVRPGPGAGAGWASASAAGGAAGRGRAHPGAGAAVSRGQFIYRIGRRLWNRLLQSAALSTALGTLLTSYLAQLEGGETGSRLWSPPAVGSCRGGGGVRRGRGCRFCTPCGASSERLGQLRACRGSLAPFCLPQSPISRVAAEGANLLGFFGAGVRECAVLVARPPATLTRGFRAWPRQGSVASFLRNKHLSGNSDFGPRRLSC